VTGGAARPRPTLKDRAEFAAYNTASVLLRTLPEPWAVGLGGALGRLAGGPLRVRRAVVDDNLAHAFPERDAAWRRRVALDSYDHLGREAVVALRLGREPAEHVLARTDVHGLEALVEAARGPGVVMATGHLGNWEIAGAAVALRGVGVDAVAVRQRNRLFDASLVSNRERLGIHVIYRGGAGAALFRSIRGGRVPALLADQDAGRNGVFVEFLGRTASTPRGPALLALRTGARLFGGACLVMGGRPRRYRIELEPLDVERTGDQAEDLRRLTEAHAAFLARFVRRAPEQYFWQHRRWKTRPSAP